MMLTSGLSVNHFRHIYGSSWRYSYWIMAISMEPCNHLYVPWRGGIVRRPTISTPDHQRDFPAVIWVAVEQRPFRYQRWLEFLAHSNHRLPFVARMTDRIKPIPPR